ncbi:MAG: amidohydrolase family protein, partial [Vulcanimicrobiaceae bacterium]
MTTLLLRNAHLLATFDDAGRIIEDGGIFVRDGAIERVGPSSRLPSSADQIIDASGMIVLPGLVNTHHHFFQTLTRNLPEAQDAELFPWLVAHYPIWGRITPDGIRSATAVAVPELMLSGCTTTADHGYIWKNGARLDDSIDVARHMGIRFHASRGSMSIGKSKGGLPPDELVEDEDAILSDCARVADAYHDASRFAMTRIVIAPCSPFSVSTELMRASAQLARERGLNLHTHLCETRDEEAYCIERFGQRSVALAERLGWTGADVWYAHGIG